MNIDERVSWGVIVVQGLSAIIKKVNTNEVNRFKTSSSPGMNHE